MFTIANTGHMSFKICYFEEKPFIAESELEYRNARYDILQYYIGIKRNCFLGLKDFDYWLRLLSARYYGVDLNIQFINSPMQSYMRGLEPLTTPKEYYKKKSHIRWYADMKLEYELVNYLE